MAMMMMGKIRSSSNASSTKGKTNAATMSSAGNPYFLSRATTLLAAPLHRRAVSEQARRPEHQDQDEHGEDHDRRPPDAYVLVGHGPYYSDQESSDDGPCEVADAAEHGGRERVQSLREANVEDGDAVEEAVHHARGAGEYAAEQERDGDSAVHVDPDHRSRLLVLRHGPHRLPLLGVAYKIGEGDEQRDGHPDHEEVLPAEDDRVGRQNVGVGDELGERDLGRTFPHEPDVLEDERHADGRYEDSQAWRVTQGLVGHAFDPHAKKAAGDHRDGHRKEHAGHLEREPGATRNGREEAQAGERAREHGQPNEGADHEVVAVGEVDQLDDPVDQRVAASHERQPEDLMTSSRAAERDFDASPVVMIVLRLGAGGRSKPAPHGRHPYCMSETSSTRLSLNSPSSISWMES